MSGNVANIIDLWNAAQEYGGCQDKLILTASFLELTSLRA
jgi:hypothetical protein